jgi:hypothetical protein
MTRKIPSPENLRQIAAGALKIADAIDLPHAMTSKTFTRIAVSEFERMRNPSRISYDDPKRGSLFVSGYENLQSVVASISEIYRLHDSMLPALYLRRGETSPNFTAEKAAKLRQCAKLISAAVPDDAKPATVSELVSRSEVARRMKICPSHVTRFVKDRADLRENDQRGSKIYFEQFRLGWENKHSAAQRNDEIRQRTEKRVIQDARRAENKLAGSQPKKATRQR